MQTLAVPSCIALRNILFATDFSDASLTALPFALELAGCYAGKVFVTHAVPYEPYLSVPLEPIPMDMDLFWNREKQNMADFMASAQFGDVAHEEILQRGELWTVISDVIRRQEIDLVVLGTHGRHGFSKVVLGSGAEKIYRHAKCPVLTIGPGVSDKSSAGWALKHILFATDFSHTSLNALPHALSLAKEKQGTLILLHLISLTVHDHQQEIEQTTRERLKALLPAEPGCQAEFAVRFDIPARGILQAARERQADLIVMGVGKPAAAPLGSHSPWSTASDVVREAPCPVLTVRG
jgi:nucleotide-binding universal stress UspA family protein